MATKLFVLLAALALMLATATTAADSRRRDLDSTQIRPRFNLDPGRIINGTYATQEATRHQVSLRRKLNDGYFFGTGHFCGGSLIRPNAVLTAAHCFMDQYFNNGTFIDKDTVIVVMGTLDRFEQANTLTFEVEQLIMQLEVFNKTTYDKDIALLILNGSVPMNHPTIRPIALNALTVPAETVCQVTGWGVTEEGYVSDVLMTVDVPMISNEECINDSDLGTLIRPGMVCAGYMEQGERDACNGDSGGPLVCHSQLAGIVSWGIGCAQPNLPGVYTEVSYYYDWILEQLGEEHHHSGDGDGDDDGSGSGDGDDDGSGSGDGDDDDDDGVAMVSVTSLSILVPALLALSRL